MRQRMRARIDEGDDGYMNNVGPELICDVKGCGNMIRYIVVGHPHGDTFHLCKTCRDVIRAKTQVPWEDVS